MNLFTNDLVNWDEPQTPRWWYHCRDHLDLPLFKFNDPHFQTGHDGKDPNCLRVRCTGSLCVECLKVPLSQDDVNPGQQDDNPESAPKKNAPNPSQTEDESSSKDDLLSYDDEDISNEDSSLSDRGHDPPTLSKQTPAGAQSMGVAEPEMSIMHAD